LLEDILPRDSSFDHFEVKHDFERIGQRTMLLNARTLRDSSHSARILLGIPNEDSAESLTILLSLAGHERHTAYDGLEALEAAETFRPDMILLDIGLPKLNGFEVARKIREQPWGQAIMLVALTGWGQEEDRRRSREAGFNHHLTKPVDPLELTNLLASLGADISQKPEQTRIPKA
jgi:CheY-like chemotaxis protein